MSVRMALGVCLGRLFVTGGPSVPMLPMSGIAAGVQGVSRVTGSARTRSASHEAFSAMTSTTAAITLMKKRVVRCSRSVNSC